MFLKSKSGKMIELPTSEENIIIKKGIASDPDTYECSDKEWEQVKPNLKYGYPLIDTKKDKVTIYLSRNVTEYFRNTSKDWKNQMDKVLQEYVMTCKT